MDADRLTQDIVIATNEDVEAWLAQEFSSNPGDPQAMFEAVWQRLRADQWEPSAERRGAAWTWAQRESGLPLRGEACRAFETSRRRRLRPQLADFASAFFELPPADRQMRWAALYQQSLADPHSQWWLFKLLPMSGVDVASVLQQPGRVAELTQLFCRLATTHPLEQELVFRQLLPDFDQQPAETLQALATLNTEPQLLPLLDPLCVRRLRERLRTEHPEAWNQLDYVEPQTPGYFALDTTPVKRRRPGLIDHPYFGHLPKVIWACLVAIVVYFVATTPPKNEGSRRPHLGVNLNPAPELRRLFNVRERLRPLTLQFIDQVDPPSGWTIQELREILHDLERAEKTRRENNGINQTDLTPEISRALDRLLELELRELSDRPSPPALPRSE